MFETFFKDSLSLAELYFWNNCICGGYISWLERDGNDTLTMWESEKLESIEMSMFWTLLVCCFKY